MAYKINKDECTNCGACEDVCPVGCIAEVGDVREINPDECIDCGACKDACPVDCITGPDA